MDPQGNIYGLDEEAQKAILGEPTPLAPGEIAALKEDVARLEGYLKGRADSDRPKRGKGANKDLAG